METQPFNPFDNSERQSVVSTPYRGNKISVALQTISDLMQGLPPETSNSPDKLVNVNLKMGPNGTLLIQGPERLMKEIQKRTSEESSSPLE